MIPRVGLPARGFRTHARQNLYKSRILAQRLCRASVSPCGSAGGRGSRMPRGHIASPRRARPPQQRLSRAEWAIQFPGRAGRQLGVNRLRFCRLTPIGVRQCQACHKQGISPEHSKAALPDGDGFFEPRVKVIGHRPGLSALGCSRGPGRLRAAPPPELLRFCPTQKRRPKTDSRWRARKEDHSTACCCPTRSGPLRSARKTPEDTKVHTKLVPEHIADSAQVPGETPARRWTSPNRKSCSFAPAPCAPPTAKDRGQPRVSLLLSQWANSLAAAGNHTKPACCRHPRAEPRRARKSPSNATALSKQSSERGIPCPLERTTRALSDKADRLRDYLCPRPRAVGAGPL